MTAGIILLAGMILSGLTVPECTEASADTADKVFVIKNKRVMFLLREGEILKSYRISLGRQPLGHKVRAGDKRTPEGTYLLDYRNPNSRFHKGFHISYPNEADTARALRLGVPPGGDIMLHGLSSLREPLGKGHRREDWTDGCIAVTNAEIEEIWKLVPDGTPIEITP